MNYNELWRQLAQVYETGEAKAIARMVYEERCGLNFSDILLGKDTHLSEHMQEDLKKIAQRLLRNEPVQYVLGEAEFCGRRFYVEPGVLIPRPETEELCALAEKQRREGGSGCTILDIGTGSGCIAVTLAADMPDTQVTAWDVSEKALAVAQKNAKRHGVTIHFQQVDILAMAHKVSPQAAFDIIVSNPPYILNKERENMEKNVLEYEPDIALFVPDENPLCFYRAIASLGTTALKAGGSLCFEINPLCVKALSEMLSTMSYRDINVYKDQYGRQRLLSAKR